MSAASLGRLRQRHGSVWEIIDWYGGWIAIRHHSWAASAEKYGIRNVLGADGLEEMAAKLEQQAIAEALRRDRPLPE